jgi:hypothetical protein
MKYGKYITALAFIFLMSSCYNAKIVTDKNPNGQTIEKKWASSFIAGLVPPSTVDTADQCENGVAMVETKLSFLNMLASAITFNLYSPMTIRVECAAAGSAAAVDGRMNDQITISKNATDQEKAEAIYKASEKSLASGQASYVAFD